MKKIANKVILVLMAAVVFLSFNTDVKAEKVCKIYRDYDFFAEVTSEERYNKEITDNGKYNVLTETDTPAGLSKDSVLVKEYQLNIIKTGTSNDTKWTLVDYYNNLKNITYNGKTETLKTSTGDTTIRVYTIDGGETENGEPVVIRYIKHGKWNAEGGEETETGFTLESLFKSTIDNLVNASVIPTGELTKLEGTGTKIKSTKKNDFYHIEIERTSLPADIEGLTTVKSTLTSGEEQNVFIAPAVYYREYEYCEEKYKAQIDYVYADTGEAAADSYIKGELDDGYTEKVKSPEIKNCTTEDTLVTVNIDGKDFYKKVEYICEKEKEPENPQTGSALIFIAWIVGIGALGYSVYYFSKLRKSKAE